MNFKLSFFYILAFLLLTIIMLEFHEISHIVVGRIVCGSWGSRDFNVWVLSDGCDENHSVVWLATLAGPVYSFMFMWIGMYLLYSLNPKVKSLGFSLIFSTMPLGRISEVLRGAGDEMVVTKRLLNDDYSLNQMIFICFITVLVLGLPPIIKAYKIIINKRAWLYILGFLTLPIVFVMVYILIIMNGILSKGLLSNTGVMGTPWIITLHTLIAIFLFSIWYKKLFQLVQIS